VKWYYKDAARRYWRIEAAFDPDGPATDDTESWWWASAVRSDSGYDDPEAPTIWDGYIAVRRDEQPSLTDVLDELAAHWARTIVGLASHAQAAEKEN